MSADKKWVISHNKGKRSIGNLQGKVSVKPHKLNVTRSKLQMSKLLGSFDIKITVSENQSLIHCMPRKGLPSILFRGSATQPLSIPHFPSDVQILGENSYCRILYLEFILLTPFLLPFGFCSAKDLTSWPACSCDRDA
jgi:hypothetical protein